MQEIDAAPAEPAATKGSKANGKAKAEKQASPKAVKKDEAKSASAKRKAMEDDEEDDDLIPVPLRTTRSTPKKRKIAEPPTKKQEPVKTPTKSAPKATAKATKKPDAKTEEDDPERKAILQSVETVALPDVEPPTGDTKFNYRAMAARPGPQNLGSKEIPVGAEDCLTVSFPCLRLLTDRV